MRGSGVSPHGCCSRCRPETPRVLAQPRPPVPRTALPLVTPRLTLLFACGPEPLPSVSLHGPQELPAHVWACAHWTSSGQPGKALVHSPRSPVVSSSGLGLCPQPLPPSFLGTPRASLGDGCPLGAVLPSGRVTVVLLSPERRAGRGSASCTPRQHRVPVSRTDTVPISFLFLKIFSSLFILRERQREHKWGAEREGERAPQAGSVPSARAGLGARTRGP